MEEAHGHGAVSQSSGREEIGVRLLPRGAVEGALSVVDCISQLEVWGIGSSHVFPQMEVLRVDLAVALHTIPYTERISRHFSSLTYTLSSFET